MSVPKNFQTEIFIHFRLHRSLLNRPEFRKSLEQNAKDDQRE
jgi:hypothetical protein